MRGGALMRFVVVDVISVGIAVGYVWLLCLAGAPGGDFDPGSVPENAGDLTNPELVLVTLVVLALAAVLSPWHAVHVRILSGTALPERISGPLRRRHWLRWSRLEERIAHLARDVGPERSADVYLRAAVAIADLRRSYPLGGNYFLPTRFGNALVAAEEEAGRRYGLDAKVVWPRLDLLVEGRTRGTVNAARNALDQAAAVSVLSAVSGLMAIPLLAFTADGEWLWLALPPFVLAWLAYAGAVRAVAPYGAALEAAFDLHRFQLYEALRLPLPADSGEERELGRQLSAMWRQGRHFDVAYRVEAAGKPEPDNRDGNPDTSPDADPEADPVAVSAAWDRIRRMRRFVEEGPAGQPESTSEPARPLQYQHPHSGDAAAQAGLIHQWGETVRDALAPPVPVAFRGVVAASFDDVHWDAEEDAWHIDVGSTQRLRVSIGLGGTFYEDRAEFASRVLGPNAGHDELLVTGGRSQDTVDLDVEIDAPFLSTVPARHSVRLASDGGFATFEVAVRADDDGPHDLRLAVFSSGRMVQALLLDLYADRRSGEGLLE